MNMESLNVELNSKSKPLINSYSNRRENKQDGYPTITSTIQSIRNANVHNDNQSGFSDGYTAGISSSRLFKLSLLAIFVYLLIGTLNYKIWMDDWTIIDAMYFTVVTFTTVGYGDLVPDGIAMTAFTIIFVSIGIIALGGIALFVIFHKFFSMYEGISKKVKSHTTQKFLNLFHGNISCDSDDEEDNCERFLASDCLGILIKTTPLLIALFIPALVTGYVEEWPVLKSLYFSVITATTVGYGDVSPQSGSGRLIAVFYIPFCVTIMSNILGQLSNVYMRRRVEASEKEFLNRKVTLKDLRQMDINDSGEVTYDEFLVFMLVTMGKVEADDIEEIEALFHRLDRNQDKRLCIRDLFEMVYGPERTYSVV